MNRLSSVLIAAIVIAVVVIVLTVDIAAQQAGQAANQQQNTPQRIANRYAAGSTQSGVNTGGLPKVTGPLGMIMGPTDDVRSVRGEGYPLAPGTDTYYSTDAVDPILDPMDWPVDEFISNPDREFDWRDLKSWHYVPVVKSATILGKRRIKAGESVSFEAVVEDLTGTEFTLFRPARP